MLEDLLKISLFDYINKNRAGNLPEWSVPVQVLTEDVTDKVFDIRDVKGFSGSIKCDPNTGEATYFNGDDQHQYILRFVRYEEFLNQFRTYKDNGEIESDWVKDWSRPDYIAYDLSESKRCMIIHELSSGGIGNKRKKGKIQLLNAVLALYKIPEIKDFLSQFEGRCYCFLSAKGCVDVTPENYADSFMEIYDKLPDPLPINNSSIAKRGFAAYETNIIKL